MAVLGGYVGVVAGLTALVYGVVRLYRPEALFFYAEGPVLWSLLALDEGGLRALYPTGGWSEPPLILSLYPPVFYWVTSTIQTLVGSHLGAARLVSLVALFAVTGSLVYVAFRQRLGWRWPALAMGVLLVVPPLFNLVGGAQVDLLGLAFTAAGLACLVPEPRGGIGIGRSGAALLFFLLAFFAKQSFVAAPAATALAVFLGGRRVQGLAFGAAFSALAATGVLVLDRITGGGFTANAFGGLGSPASLLSTLRAVGQSAPWAWGPLLVVLALAVRRELRPEIPELYAVVAWTLHLLATARVGASVNYLAEPLFAAVLVGLVRAPRGIFTLGPTGAEGLLPSSPGTPRPSASRRVALAAVTALLLGTAGAVAAEVSVRILPAMRAPSPFEIRGRVEGYPLTEAEVFTALMAVGSRPWLNDPLAFGALLDVGRWNPAPLVADLEAGRIPFLATFADLTAGPAPPEMGSDELLFGYLWLAPAVWEAATSCYRPIGRAGPLYVWHPGDGC